MTKSNPRHPNQEIDPDRIEDLQRFLLHGILVAGKTAAHANAALDRFLAQNSGRTPFGKIRRLLTIPNSRFTLRCALQNARTGNYRKNTRAFIELAFSRLPLRTCRVEDLEAIYGISRKTARYFMLYTRPDARVAALDVHMLKFLRHIGVEAPKNTPSSLKRYEELQDVVLKMADDAHMTPAQLDYHVWKYYSQNNQATGPPRTIMRKINGKK
jgi:thermostable 8-oxoguanine DNA glycosylase